MNLVLFFPFYNTFVTEYEFKYVLLNFPTVVVTTIQSSRLDRSVRGSPQEDYTLLTFGFGVPS